MPIASFRHRGLQELFETGRSRRIGPNFRAAAILILDHLDAITDLKDCVGVRGFHPLTGNRRGTYAMTVSANYRITFGWQAPDVIDVDLEDYH